MAYTPNATWQDGSAGGTPITAGKLNRLEQGLVAAAGTADAATTYSEAQTAAANMLVDGVHSGINWVIDEDTGFASGTVLGGGTQLVAGPAWTAGATVAAGVVQNLPDGTRGARTAAGTTRPTFDATESALYVRTTNTAVLVHNGTAYPARPSSVLAPPGFATYVGPIAPTDGLAGDEWRATA